MSRRHPSTDQPAADPDAYLDRLTAAHLGALVARSPIEPTGPDRRPDAPATPQMDDLDIAPEDLPIPLSDDPLEEVQPSAVPRRRHRSRMLLPGDEDTKKDLRDQEQHRTDFMSWPGSSENDLDIDNPDNDLPTR